MTYFGQCNANGTFKGTLENSDSAVAWWATYACPGSGPQSLSHCGIYAKTASTMATIRMAIYNSAGTSKLFESGTGTLTTTEQWVNLTISGTLTGGTSYLVACTVNSDGVWSTKCGPDSVNWKISGSPDYTAGFPATMPTADDSGTNLYPFRVLVTAAASLLPRRSPLRFFPRRF